MIGRRNRWMLVGAALLSTLFLVVTLSWAADEEAIDWDRARQIHRRSKKGEALTDEEKQFLKRAMEARRGGAAQRQGGGKKGGEKRAKMTGKDSVGFTPLSEMAADGEYKGENGGLYGDGQNEPPKAHLKAAKKALAEIQPLDTDGKPSKDGKIVLISIGMSNTTQEFSRFAAKANSDPEKSASAVIVDGAQGGMAAEHWAYPGRAGKDPWKTLESRLQQAGVAASQVQAAWIKLAKPRPAKIGEFPEHAKVLKNDIIKILNRLKETYPNLHVAYLSSRIYAGYANSPLNPEPYAYEGAFSVRWVIRDQIADKPELNFDPKQGEVKAPLVLWGPYLWADGTTPREGDELIWERKDFGGDGTHPSNSGREKVADMLLKFFKTDSTAAPWFVAKKGNKSD